MPKQDPKRKSKKPGKVPPPEPMAQDATAVDALGFDLSQLSDQAQFFLKSAVQFLQPEELQQLLTALNDLDTQSDPNVLYGNDLREAVTGERFNTHRTRPRARDGGSILQHLLNGTTPP